MPDSHLKLTKSGNGEKNMAPNQLANLLSATIPAHLPVLITGAPGVGKTDVVTEAAAQAGAELIISHPVVSDPTDAKGLPWVGADKKSATFLPFGEMKRALDAKDLTVWFLDDLGQASPAVQASFMQLILARRINGHELPKHIVFVAATNRRTDRAGVAGILEPVKSRFASIVQLETNLDDWCQWAIGKQLPVELIAFLRFRRELLHDFNPSADLTNSPSPRTWHSVAKLLALNLPADIELAAFQGAVGEGPAAEFSAFLRMYRSLPNLDGILLDPDNASISDKPNVNWAVSTGLASKATEANFGRIARYAERMEKAGHGEFSVLMIRDCMRREPKVCQTAEFVRLASSEVGKLIIGQ
jgi:hypothetical protein